MAMKRTTTEPTTEKPVDFSYMSPDQIADLKQDIDVLDNMLKGDGNRYIQDKAEFITNLRNKKDLLATHTPEKVSGAKASKMYKRAKELRERIQSHMVPSRSFNLKYPKDGSSFDFERAVNQQIAFQTDKSINAEILEYKRIMRVIDPDNPEVINIESFRP